MAKPVRPRALLARLRTHLRRATPAEKASNPIKIGSLVVDAARRSVKLDGRTVDLTTAEFEMLKLFAENPQKPLDRDFMMEQTRGIPWESFNRSVDVVVSRLRQKLGDDPRQPRFLKTIWGTGYMFIGTPVETEETAE